MRSTKPEDPGMDLAELTDPEREAATERFRIIWPFLEAGVPLKRLAQEHGKSLRTLRYWVAVYRDGDLPALVPRRRSDRGKRRMREELKALAEALWLREPRRPVSSIHRQAARDAEKRGWPVPSYVWRRPWIIRRFRQPLRDATSALPSPPSTGSPLGRAR